MYKLWLMSGSFFMLGFVVGGFAVWHFFPDTESRSVGLISSRLREDSGKYTNPLLMCDIDSDLTTDRYLTLESTLKALISDAQKIGINTASVYFRDIQDGSAVYINSDERFTPASLNKVPLMIASLMLAQKDDQFLATPFVHHATKDANAVQMIQPSDSLKSFASYTVEDALRLMITHSDNNAYDVLTGFVDYQDYLNNFRTLKIPIETETGVSAKEYSYFLRVLYNSTLLSREMSEKALGWLAQSDYDRALRAGVPADITMAHKFGASGGVDDDGKPIDRELHDCGIVYLPNKPYLLCVMTRGNTQLENIEGFIAGVSKLVYENMSQRKEI